MKLTFNHRGPWRLRAALLPALLTAMIGVAHSAGTAGVSQTFFVRDVRVFDGDGLIARVGRHLTAPAGVTVVEGAGRTLLPGLIDAHTHSWGNARRDAVRFGVTTELDMFSDWHQIAAARRERESLAPAAVADLWSAGTLATVPHGHGTEYGMPIPTLTKPAEAPDFVAARFREGSDYLKIILEDGSAYGQHIPSLDAATVQALVAAAHTEHHMAIAHVATEHDAEVAVDAGIDGLAHVFLDRPASPAFIAAARAHGVFVVATLAVSAGIGGADGGRLLSEDARLRPWLTSAQRDSLRAQFPPAFRVVRPCGPERASSARRRHSDPRRNGRRQSEHRARRVAARGARSADAGGTVSFASALVGDLAHGAQVRAPGPRARRAGPACRPRARGR
jgi:hypothetical protein